MLPEWMEDDGLVVRRWVVGDAEALQVVISESASHLRPSVTWVEEEAISIEQRRLCIAERGREWRGGGSVLLGIFVGERIAGGCSLDVRADATGVLEIGYWLHPAFEGHGLATRAARLLTEAALATPNVRTVEIATTRLTRPAAPCHGGWATCSLARRPTARPRRQTQVPTWFGAGGQCRRTWCCDCRSSSLIPIAVAAAGRSLTGTVPRCHLVSAGGASTRSCTMRSSCLSRVQRLPLVSAGARAWVLMPDELPRSVGVGSVFTLLEGDHIIGRAEISRCAAIQRCSRWKTFALPRPAPRGVRPPEAPQSRSATVLSSAAQQRCSDSSLAAATPDGRAAP